MSGLLTTDLPLRDSQIQNQVIMTCKYRLDILSIYAFGLEFWDGLLKVVLYLKSCYDLILPRQNRLCLRFWTKPCQSMMPHPWRVYWKSLWFSGRAFTETWRAIRRPEATLSASSLLCSPSTWKCSRWDRHTWHRRDDICAEVAGVPHRPRASAAQRLPGRTADPTCLAALHPTPRETSGLSARGFCFSGPWRCFRIQFDLPGIQKEEFANIRVCRSTSVSWAFRCWQPHCECMCFWSTCVCAVGAENCV